MNIQPSTNCIHDYIELREHGQVGEIEINDFSTKNKN